MNSTQKNPLAYVPGAVLALFIIIIPLLISNIALQKRPVEAPHENIEFSDVRVQKLNIPSHHAKKDLVEGVIVHSSFTLNSVWCQRGNTKALPCPRPLWRDRQGDPAKNTKENIPLL